MQQVKRNKVSIQQPDLRVSKNNQKKAEDLFDNFLNGIKRELKKDLRSFSLFASIKRLITKDKTDPASKHVVEVVKRMEKDKMHSQIALQLSETATMQIQNMQKLVLVKMIPFFLSSIGMIICVALASRVRPWDFNNFELQKFLIPLAIILPVFIWSLSKRKEVKVDMLAINILLQSSSAFASAKMTGQGTVAAMLNLEQMKRKAEKLSKKKK